MVISARNFIRAFGGSVGLAIAQNIFSSSLLEHIPKNTPTEVAQAIADSIFHLPDISQITEAQQIGVLDAYATASRNVFYLWAGAMASCLVLMIFIKDEGLSRNDSKQTHAEAGVALPTVEVKSVEVPSMTSTSTGKVIS